MQSVLLLPSHVVRSCRLIAGRRYALTSSTPYRYFHQSPLRQSRTPPEANGSSDPNNGASNDVTPVDVHNHSSGENAEPAVAKSSTIGRKSYIAGLRRNLKDKRPSIERSPVRATIPQWFHDRNVVLYHENDVTETPSSRSVVIQTSSTKDEQTNQSEATGGDDTGEAGQPGSRGDRYLIDSAVWEKLYASAKAGFMLPSPEFANDPATSQSHLLLLQYPGDDGMMFLDSVVQKLGHDLKANLVTLNAQDIAQLCSEQERVQGSELSSMRNLGYEIYKDRYSPPSVSDIGNEGWEKDDGAPEQTSEPFLSPSSRPRIVSVESNLPDIQLPSWLLSLTGSGADNQTKRSSPHTELTIWTRLIDQILSPTAKSASTSRDGDEHFIQDTEKGSNSQATVIIHIQDYGDLRASRAGSKFLNLLQKMIKKRRRHGERILLVGTFSKDRIPASWSDTSQSLDGPNMLSIQQALSSHQNAFDNPFARALVVVPAMDLRTAKHVFAEDGQVRTTQINIRHIQDMVRARVDQNNTPLDNSILENTWWNLDEGSKLKTHLRLNYWNFTHVHALVTYAMGSTQPNEKFGLDQLEQAVQILERNQNLYVDWLKERPSEPASSDSNEPRKASFFLTLPQKCNKYERKLINGVVKPENIRTTFADVHVPPDTVEALKTLTSLSLLRPEAFTYGVLATDKIPGMLLYGPPGTGKTLLAKAVARESGATVLEVSGSDIYDMYVGEGEKNVRAVFSLAKKLSPCVVFLDEADAIFGSRSGNRHRSSHRELINQFLREWDGMNDMSAFIMVATNRPFDLDDAVLRRLPRRLLVDLPTEQDRESILRIHLKSEQLDASVDLAELARRTPFYSGSDLKNVCVAAALACVREEYAQGAGHSGERPYEYPQRRVLTQAHFERGMEEISASISEDMSSLNAIRKFDEKYGDRKGRRKKSAAWGFTPPRAAERGETARVRT